jgi:putative hemolysin
MTSSIWNPPGLAAPGVGAAPARLLPPSRRPSLQHRARAALRAVRAWLARAAAERSAVALADADLARLPAAGPVLAVARADRGASLALGRALAGRRPDVSVVAGGPAGARAAAVALRGGRLVVAPARDLRALEQLVALARATGAALVPMAIAGSLRGAPWAAVGASLEAKQMDAAGDDAGAAQLLGWRLAAAASRGASASALAPSLERTMARAAAPVVARGDRAWIEAEIEALPPEAQLAAHERFLVATARAPRIPALLREIGRLRELTFRAVGEGTGRELDLDAFDRTYDHLFVWDRRERELVGAYRLASTARILPLFGAQGLYTSTLFRYAPGFFEALGPAVELGRSFVRPEYQRSSVALLLLWKAIARFVGAEPRAHKLFGAVSISAEYTPWSRSATARILSETRGDGALGRHVAPRTPLRSAGIAPSGLRTACFADAGALSALVAEAEPTGRGLPVLVREYLKLGGRFLAWNVDPDFGDALDGLVVVDLTRTERRILEFYMGKPEAGAFLARHAGSSGAGDVARATA